MVWDKSYHHNYKSAKYKRNRALAMRRDQYLCQYCLVVDGRITPATECDHIQPVSKGVTDELSNLQALCNDHHWIKTHRESRGKVGFPPIVDWRTGYDIEDHQDRIIEARGKDIEIYLSKDLKPKEPELDG